MTNGELISLFIKRGKEYAPKAIASIGRNDHMHELREGELPSQKQVDAVVTDFINYMGSCNGIDVGLYTQDLNA